MQATFCLSVPGGRLRGALPRTCRQKATSTEATKIQAPLTRQQQLQLGKSTISKRDSAVALPIEPLPLSPWILTKAISSCSTWDQLHVLLQTHARGMNTIHVSALMVRLAKLVGKPSSCATIPSPATATVNSPSQRRSLERLLREVSALVSVRLDAFDARGLANTMWAVARLGFVPSHTLLQRFLFATFVRMHLMAPQEVANLAWAVATMRVPTGRAWADRLAQHVLRTAAGMRPQELANTAWALQQLGSAPQPAPPVLQSTSSTTPTASPTAAHESGMAAPMPDPGSSDAGPSLHTSLQLLAEPPTSALRTPIGQAQAQALMEAARAQLAGFRPFELMMLLLALQGSVQGSSATRNGWSLLLQDAAHALTPQLRALSVHDVSNLGCMVAWDVRRQQQQQQRRLTAAVSAVRREAVGLWSTADAQSLVQGLGEALARDMAARSRQFKPIDWVRTLWALSTLGMRPPTNWLVGILHSMEDTLASPGAAGSHPGEVLQLSPASMTTCLGSLAQLAQRQPDSQAIVPLVPALASHVAAYLPSFSSSQLVHVCTSMVRLGWLRGESGGEALRDAVSGELGTRLRAGECGADPGRTGFTVADLCHLSQVAQVLHTGLNQQLVAAQLAQAQVLAQELLQGHAAPPGLEAGALGTAEARAHATDLASLVICLLSARTRAHVGPPHDDDDDALDRVLAATARCGRLLQAQHLLMLCVGLSRAGLRPPVSIMSRLLDALTPHLPGLALWEHSRLLVAVARIGFQPPEVWMTRALSAAASAAVKRQSAEDTASILWALAKLRAWLPKRAVIAWFRAASRTPSLKRLLSDQPAVCIRTAWALQRLAPHTLGMYKVTLLHGAAAAVGRLSTDEALWALEVAATTSTHHLHHSHWRTLLLQGVLGASGTAGPSAAHLTPAQLHRLLRCMRRVRWSRSWPMWRRAYPLLQAQVRAHAAMLPAAGRGEEGVEGGSEAGGREGLAAGQAASLLRALEHVVPIRRQHMRLTPTCTPRVVMHATAGQRRDAHTP